MISASNGFCSIASDDELLRAVQFELSQAALSRPGVVEGALPLGDDALEVQLLRWTAGRRAGVGIAGGTLCTSYRPCGPLRVLSPAMRRPSTVTRNILREASRPSFRRVTASFSATSRAISSILLCFAPSLRRRTEIATLEKSVRLLRDCEIALSQ